MNWKNIIERALWTFVEGFLIALPLDGEITRAAIMGALMAGLSALKTLIIEVSQNRLNSKE